MSTASAKSIFMTLNFPGKGMWGGQIKTQYNYNRTQRDAHA